MQKEREKAEALASELATARRDLESQKALLSKSGDETAKPAAAKPAPGGKK